MTAQKRAENIQNVPIAITALSGTELQNRTVTGLADLKSATPSVVFNSTAEGVFATSIGIRGLHSGEIELTSDQPVATYIDDVYQSSAAGNITFLGPDIERIEVLRGPQGTLFGRNTIGGAVSIHTTPPSEQDFSGRVMAGVGDHGIKEGQAMVNVPLATDLAAFRFNVGFRENDGFAKDSTYGRDLGNTNQVYLRGQLRLTPTNRLNILISGDYSKAKSDGSIIQPVYLTRPSALPGGFSPAFTALALAYGIVPIEANFDQVQQMFFSCGGGPTPTLGTRCSSPQVTNPNTTTGPFSPQGRMSDTPFYHEWGTAANIAYQLADNLELKSITAYRKFEDYGPKDYTAISPVLLFANNDQHGETFTEELQLNGKSLADRLKYTLGGYYYHFTGLDDTASLALPVLAGDYAAERQPNHIHNRSLAFFGQGTFAITDRLNVTGGIRYTKEHKKADETEYSSIPASAVSPNYYCSLPFPNAACVNTTRLQYQSVDWSGGLDYKPADHILIYFRAAKGFQSGGINQVSAPGVAFQTFEPETAKSYEVGAKTELLDRRVLFNFAVYQNNVSNYQLTVPKTFISADGAGVSIVSTINAATVRIRGAEAELTVVPFRGAQLKAQVGYTDPKYLKFVADGPDGPGTLDLSHTPFLQVPKWTFGISPSYTLPVSFGEVHFQIDYSYQTKQDLGPSLSYPTEATLPIPALQQRGFGLLNGRIAAHVGTRTEIAAWVKNLADKRYFSGALNLAGSLGLASATVGDPRTFGLQVSQKF